MKNWLFGRLFVGFSRFGAGIGRLECEYSRLDVFFSRFGVHIGRLVRFPFINFQIKKDF
jgi:hypothetical protein